MNTDILELKQRTVSGMKRYMEAVAKDGGQVSYTQAHIDTADDLLTSFIQEIDAFPEKSDTAWVHERIKTMIFALNDLNDSAGGELIETGQRDYICMLIDKVMAAIGRTVDEELIYEWREW